MSHLDEEIINNFGMYHLDEEIIYYFGMYHLDEEITYYFGMHHLDEVFSIAPHCVSKCHECTMKVDYSFGFS